jgi:hypothetical protein
MITLLKPAAATAAISSGLIWGATAKSEVRELIGVATKGSFKKGQSRNTLAKAFT